MFERFDERATRVMKTAYAEAAGLSEQAQPGQQAS